MLLPLPTLLARALPWSLDDVVPGIVVTVADLADGAFVAALTPAEVRALADALTVRLGDAMASGALPRPVQEIVVPWTPAMLDLFEQPARARLVSAGWGGRKKAAATALERLLPEIGDDLAGLVRLVFASAALRVERRDDTANDEGHGSLPGQAIASTCYDPGAPPRWRADRASERILRLPDGACLSTCDPRYGWWLATLLNGIKGEALALVDLQSLPSSAWSVEQRRSLAALSAGLERANKLTTGQEIEELALASLRVTRNVPRAVRMVLAKYGTDGVSRSLDDVADMFGGLTRQAIHHTIRIGTAACGPRTYAPALRRLESAVNAAGPGAYALIERSLRDLLGPTQRLDGAVQFGQDFVATKSAFQVVRARNRTTAVLSWEDPRDPSFNAILDATRSIARRRGAVHWSDVVASMSERLQRWVRRQEFESAVDAHPLGVWLDKAAGWASFADLLEGANRHQAADAGAATAEFGDARLPARVIAEMVRQRGSIDLAPGAQVE